MTTPKCVEIDGVIYVPASRPGVPDDGLADWVPFQSADEFDEGEDG